MNGLIDTPTLLRDYRAQRCVADDARAIGPDIISLATKHDKKSVYKPEVSIT